MPRFSYATLSARPGLPPSRRPSRRRWRRRSSVSSAVTCWKRCHWRRLVLTERCGSALLTSLARLPSELDGLAEHAVHVDLEQGLLGARGVRGRCAARLSCRTSVRPRRELPQKILSSTKENGGFDLSSDTSHSDNLPHLRPPWGIDVRAVKATRHHFPDRPLFRQSDGVGKLDLAEHSLLSPSFGDSLGEEAGRPATRNAPEPAGDVGYLEIQNRCAGLQLPSIHIVGLQERPWLICPART